MAKMGVWSVATVSITGDEGESGTAVLVVDEDEGELVANDLWTSMGEGEAVATSLKQLFGEVGRPRKIVVKSGTLAKSMRAAGVREEIAVGATPRLDALMEELENDASALAMPGSLEGEGATADVVRAFFEAAEVLRMVAPWRVLEPGTGFAVEALALEIGEGAAFVVRDEDGASEGGDEDGEAASGLPGGWMMLDSAEDLEALGEAAEAGRSPDASVMAFAYERAEALGPTFEAFAREHDLAIPAEGWVPTLSRSKRGVGQVAVSGAEYELATAICTAIANITATLVDAEEGAEEEVLLAQITTASGMEVLVEGPMIDEDDEEDGGTPA
jgi:hypothetical protein